MYILHCKKSISILFIVLIFSLTPLFSKATFGIKGSLFDTSFRGDEWEQEKEEYDFKNDISLSHSIGCFTEIPLFKYLFLQPELNYASSEIKYSENDDSSWESMELSMFEVPIYLKLLYPAGKGHIYLMGGPEFSIVFGDILFANSDGDTGYLEYSDIFHYGAAMGVGYEIDMDSGALIFGLKYSTDFTGMYGDPDLTTYSLGVEMGYKFNY